MWCLSSSRLKEKQQQSTRPKAAWEGNLPPYIVQYALGFLATLAERS